jgi:hypothetical protein
MALGVPPIIESILGSAGRIWPEGAGDPVRLLDIGGGDGTLGIQLSQALPALRVDVYNLPSLRELVEKKIDAAGSTVKFVGGDFLKEPFPRGYDTLSFVRVLHDWPDPVAVELMRKAYDALPPRGQILICEEFRTPERLAVQFFWSYFLIGLDQCVSRLREVDFYSKVLCDIGFVEVRCLPGPFDIVVAVKP